MKKKNIEKRLKAIEVYLLKKKMNLQKIKNIILLILTMLTVYIPMGYFIFIQPFNVFLSFLIGMIVIIIGLYFLGNIKKVN